MEIEPSEFEELRQEKIVALKAEVELYGVPKPGELMDLETTNVLMVGDLEVRPKPAQTTM